MSLVRGHLVVDHVREGGQVEAPRSELRAHDLVRVRDKVRVRVRVRVGVRVGVRVRTRVGCVTAASQK